MSPTTGATLAKRPPLVIVWPEAGGRYRDYSEVRVLKGARLPAAGWGRDGKGICNPLRVEKIGSR